MKITNEIEMQEALNAIEQFKRRSQEYEVGGIYQWTPGKAWHNQGLRHGVLKCVYVGHHQGLFEDNLSEVGTFENRNGLHIIALGHLKSGDFKRVD